MTHRRRSWVSWISASRRRSARTLPLQRWTGHPRDRSSSLRMGSGSTFWREIPQSVDEEGPTLCVRFVGAQRIAAGSDAPAGDPSYGDWRPRLGCSGSRSRRSKYIVVSNSTDNSISIINATDNEEKQKVTVGPTPGGVMIYYPGAAAAGNQTTASPTGASKAKPSVLPERLDDHGMPE